MARPDRPLISVVLSFRNEADNIPTLVARLEKMFAGENVDYEVLFVNDASTDASLSLLIAERQRNPRVKIVNMSRRFGVAEGVIAGMATSRGDAVVYMDADLQDPPEVIPRLIDRWRQGADVVHTVRTQRHGENAAEDGGHAAGLSADSVRLVDRAAGRCRRLQAVVAFRCRSSAAVARIRPLPPRPRRVARLQPGLRPVRARLAPCRPDAFSVLQPESLEDVHDGADVVLVHADLRLFRAGGRGPGCRRCCWRSPARPSWLLSRSSGRPRSEQSPSSAPISSAFIKT